MRAGDTCGARAQAEIEGVFSSKSHIETSNGTTWVPESFELSASTRVQVRVDIIQFPSAEDALNYSRCGLQLKNPGLIAVCCCPTLVFRRRAQLGVSGGFSTPNSVESSLHHLNLRSTIPSLLYLCKAHVVVVIVVVVIVVVDFVIHCDFGRWLKPPSFISHSIPGMYTWGGLPSRRWAKVFSHPPPTQPRTRCVSSSSPTRVFRLARYRHR